MGRYSDDLRLATISRISTAPLDSRAGPFSLVRGIKGLQTWLDRLWQSNAGYYVGEWHYHPFSSPRPSRRDVRQMRQIARTDDYECAAPILLILGGDPAVEWQLRLEVFTRVGQRIVLEPVARL